MPKLPTNRHLTAKEGMGSHIEQIPQKKSRERILKAWAKG
jgi:hypothetical protein